MSTTSASSLRLSVRVGHVLRPADHWWQLGRYAAVGVAGWVVSISVFALADRLGAGYILAASVAFVFALAHNFAWNRHWTFRAGAGHAGFQWLRWVLINVGALLV